MWRDRKRRVFEIGSLGNVYSDDEGCGTLAYLKVGTDKILNLTNLFF